MALVQEKHELFIKHPNSPAYAPYSTTKYTQSEAVDVCITALQTLPVGTVIVLHLSPSARILY